MAITYDKDSDGIVLLTLDMPDHSANVLNDVFSVVIVSRKNVFLIDR